jgi:arginine decarboxylase-like protein
MEGQDGDDRLQRLQGQAYIETALLAQRLGVTTLIIVDRFHELETIIECSKRLGLKPHIGVRAKLASAARAAGPSRAATAASSA